MGMKELRTFVQDDSGATLVVVGAAMFAMGLVGLISPLVDAPAFSNPNVDNATVITCTIVLIVAGVFAGLVPSIKAAHIKPIEALRAD